MPGTILALWILFALLAMRGSGLQNSIWLLAIAYSLKYMSVGISLIQPSVMATHPSLVEAATLFGADLFARLRRIWIPMLKWSLWGALFLVLMPCLAELSMTTLLNGPKTQNLGVLLFDLQEYSDRASASVIGSVILVCMTALQIAKERMKPHGR
jgi:iron(III) transport system permease protein